MKVILIALIAFTFSISNSIAQSEENDFIVGKTLTIQSAIMEDQREIQIFLPENYSKSNANFPVLYILDGQRYFLHGVSLQKSFLKFKQTAEFIIVGISTKRSDRNRVFNQDAQKYLSYIETEVIAMVDRKYRSSQERMVFGWGYAGGFVLQTLLNRPSLFDAYIAASPYPIEDKLNAMDSLLSTNTLRDRILFFTSETNDGTVKKQTEKLKALLLNKDPKDLNWTFKKLEGEEHRSTAFSTLYHGIQKYYEYFPELQFSNLEEFRVAGGLSYVHKYYNQRALRFGLQPVLTDWTMFSLTRNAIRENDFGQFEIFISEFTESKFLERINLNRSMAIADFYLNNKKYDQALGMYNLLSEIHPESKNPLIGLGDTYKAMNDDENAKLFYNKAKELGQN